MVHKGLKKRHVKRNIRTISKTGSLFREFDLFINVPQIVRKIFRYNIW